MRKITLAIAAISLLAASCGKDTTPTPPPAPAMARATFVNTIVGADNVKATVDFKEVDANSINLLAASGYRSITPGNNLTTIFILTSASIGLDTSVHSYIADKSYSVFGTGSLLNAEVVFTLDDLAAPASGKAKVRFANLSNQLLTETVTVGTTAIATGTAYKTVTPFVEVTAGSLDIVAVDPTQVPLTKTLSGKNFEAGRIYTIFLSGNNGASGNNDLKLSVMDNN